MKNLEIFVFLAVSIFCMMASNVLFNKKQDLPSGAMAALAFGGIFASTLLAISANLPDTFGLIAAITAILAGSFAIVWSKGYKIATTAYYIAALVYLIGLL